MPATFATKLCLGLVGVASAGAAAVEEASLDECADGECSSLMQLKGKSPAAGRPASSNPFAKGILEALQSSSEMLTASEGRPASPNPFLKMLLEAVQTSSRETSAEGEGSNSTEGFCPVGVEVKPLEPAQSAVLVDKGYLKKDSFAWWDMPVQQPFSNLQKVGQGLSEIAWPLFTAWDKRWPLMKKGSAADVASKMFQATKVSGVFEKMPEKLRGVFWMKGNGVPEELTVMHFGKWTAQEDMLLQSFAPFTWAWPAGKPKDAPYLGLAYSNDESMAMIWASMFTDLAPTFSYKFSDQCLGSYCQDAKSRSMKYAYMQASLNGQVSKAANMAGEMAAEHLGRGDSFNQDALQGAFTLQELPESVNGSHWKRTCHWGLGKTTCAAIEFGTYDLIKILDADGQPIQPQYDEFIEYMGNVPLFVWAGWKSEEEKNRVAQDRARTFW